MELHVNTGTERAHSLLEALLTKALYQGKSLSSTLYLPYTELAHHHKLKHTNNYQLKLEIRAVWTKDADHE